MTNVYNDADNEYVEEKIQRFTNSWQEVYNLNAWASIIYLVFWFPPWTLFCFVWVLCTGSISVVFSLVLPPLGYLFSIATVASWRSLARIEVITTSFCANPKNFIIDTIPEITRRTPLYPITKISLTNPVYPNTIRLGIKFCLNKYTYDSLPPFIYFGLPIICTYCSKFGEKLILDSRIILSIFQNMIIKCLLRNKRDYLENLVYYNNLGQISKLDQLRSAVAEDVGIEWTQQSEAKRKTINSLT
ncbi:hypothetical protein GLOIN_2v828849 [Rhizophagus irregularis DAOM 181602=DAOM 197198]|nr:hypothetical protein GLOIN_2v828849 [Rhizophagus irregularis DAOM 181602=DAOM 197198]